MKSKQLNFKQILKLHLLKHKTYEQHVQKKESNLIIDTNLNQMLINFKKILQIIFQYHIKEKKILFIGVPHKLESQINRATHHSAISNSSDINGLLSNSSNVGSKNMKPLFPKLNRIPDLVVLIAHEKSENFLKECSVMKLPVINLTDSERNKNVWSTYSYGVRLNSDNKNLSQNNNLFFIGLSFLFKIRKQSHR